MDTQSQSRRLKVFLWYAFTDRFNVREIYNFLTSYNIDVYYKEEDLLPGQTDVSVQLAIQNADVIILCMSEDSKGQEGKHRSELESILDLHKTKPEDAAYLFPLKLNRCDVDFKLQRFHFVEFFGENKNTALNKLKKVLQLRSEQLKIIPPNEVSEYLQPAEWSLLINYFLSGDFAKNSELSPFCDLRDNVSGTTVHEAVVNALLKEKKKIVLVGDGGTGKTISLIRLVHYFARQYGLEAVTQGGLAETTSLKIPIYFNFHSVPAFTSAKSLDALCAKEIEKIMADREFPSLLRLLNIPNTRWVLFFDGIDEIQNRENAAPALKEWLELLPRNVQCVLTSRPYCVGEGLGDVSIEIASLRKKEVDYLIQNKIKLFDSEEVESDKQVSNDRSKKLINQIMGILDENPSLYHLLRRPRAIDGLVGFLKNPHVNRKHKENITAHTDPFALSHKSKKSIPLLPKIRSDELINSLSDYSSYLAGRKFKQNKSDLGRASKLKNEKQKYAVRDFRLGELVDAVITHLKECEIERQPQIGADDFKEVPETAMHILEKIAWEIASWNEITFNYEDVPAWSKHAGFVKKIRYPTFAFCEEIARCYFAATFGFSKPDTIAHDAFLKYRNKSYTPMILKIYNDLRHSVGRSEFGHSMEGA